jgi:catechol 2,3-dioxygenase-like lactoylglutathione lyase family enzyme
MPPILPTRRGRSDRICRAAAVVIPPRELLATLGRLFKFSGFQDCGCGHVENAAAAASLDQDNRTQWRMAAMSPVRCFDHVGSTVDDLDLVTAFFVGLGLEVEGRTFVEGEFLDTVIGIPDSRTEIVMLRPPGGRTGIELSSFVRPDHEPGSPSRWRTNWACAASSSRSTTFRWPSTAWLRTDTDGRRHRPAREHLADGLRARARGDHRLAGRADRLTRERSPRAI